MAELSADNAELSGRLSSHEQMLALLMAMLSKNDFEFVKGALLNEASYLEKDSPMRLLYSSQMRQIAQRVLSGAERIRQSVSD